MLRRPGGQRTAPLLPDRTLGLRWLQFWLQLAAFTVIPIRTRPYFSAGRTAYGTIVNRPERDHDGLAVWGSGVRVPSAPLVEGQRVSTRTPVRSCLRLGRQVTETGSSCLS